MRSVRFVTAMLVALVAMSSAAAAGTVDRPAAVPGAADVARLLRGIPQHGSWLGKESAPLTLVEYVDVQCPFCAQFSREVFPTVVRRYVRTGRVRILFRGLAIVGPDSTAGLRAVVGAGKPNRLWNLLELLFANQGAENSGWLTTARISKSAAAVAGLDPKALARNVPAKWVSAQVQTMATAAKRARVPGTPFFELGRPPGSFAQIQLKSFDPADFTSRIDDFLK